MKLGRVTRLEPAELRLPLIALIDVVLFLLMYFLFAGTLEAQERHLAESLGSDGASANVMEDLQPQVIEIESGDGGRAAYRLGTRVIPGRAELQQVLRQLPKDIGIVIRAADTVSVAAVAAATQTCRDAGFHRISFVPRSTTRP